MNRTRRIHHPFDYGFTLMFEEFPEEFVEVLKAPGKFVKKANTQVKLPNGKTGTMDAPYLADPDYIKLFEKALVLLEHQRDIVDGKKSYMISNYVIQGVSDEKVPFIILIASHIEKEKHEQEFERTDSFVIRFQFLDLGERDNWERLNTMRNRVRFNNEHSIKDILNLGIIVLFAPEDCAKERTREALYYLLKSKINSKRLEFVSYSVFYCMIDAYFDDENEFNEMIRMLEQKTNPETIEQFQSEIRLKNELSQVSAERDEISAENNKLRTKTDEITAENTELKTKTHEISAERDLAYALITLLLSEVIDSNDESIKKKLNPFKNILKKCNV